MAKRFNKGDVVEINPSTTLQRWTDARYLGTTTSAGQRRHAVMVLMYDGSSGYRLEVPSRRIRTKVAVANTPGQHPGPDRR